MSKKKRTGVPAEDAKPVSERDAARQALEQGVRDGNVAEVARSLDVDVLHDVVVTTIFAMAAGKIGTPFWLREAERALGKSAYLALQESMS